jgi:hypothetical protein
MINRTTISRDVVVEGGSTAFSVRWRRTVAFHLVDPTGQTINPSYVDTIMDGLPTDPDAEITTEVPNEMVAYMGEGGSAGYYFPNARPGTWEVVVVAENDVPAGGTFFSSEVAFESPFAVEFASDSLFLTPGTTAGFTVQLPPVASATVGMSVKLPGGGIVPLTPTPQGGDAYAATWNVPNDSGYAVVNWSVTGTRTDGVAFERGGYEIVQITSTQLTWNGIQAEEAPPRPGDPTLLESLVLDTAIGSGYAGAALVSAELVDASGQVVARANQTQDLTSGPNTVVLTFDGGDIYASGLDGRPPHQRGPGGRACHPDPRGSGVRHLRAGLCNRRSRAITTCRASRRRAVCRRVGQSIDLCDRRRPGGALSYAGTSINGSFETSGQSVQFAAPLVDQTTSMSARKLTAPARTRRLPRRSSTCRRSSRAAPPWLNHEIVIDKPLNSGPPGSTGVES